MLSKKELCCYLPYKVKITNLQTIGNPNLKIGTLNKLYEFRNEWYYATKECHTGSVKKIKLILRPLSDLTKPIQVEGYNDGKEFAPIEVIGRTIESSGSFEDGYFGWNRATGGDDFQDYYITIDKGECEVIYKKFWCGNPEEGGYVYEVEELSYKTYNLLLSWYFDIFGLIERGDAVYINTLEI